MIYFIVFLPLIGFLYCAFFGNKFDEKYSQLFTSSLLIFTDPLFQLHYMGWILFWVSGNSEIREIEVTGQPMYPPIFSKIS